MTHRPIRMLVALSLIATLAALSAAPLAAQDAATDDGAPEALPAGGQQIAEVTEGMELFKSLKFEEALNKFREAAENHSQLPPGEVMMAQIFSNIRNPQAGKAIRQYLDLAAQESPQDPEAYVVLGDLARRESRITDAELLYAHANSLLGSFDKNAVRKKAMQTRVHAGLGAVASARQNWEEAEKQFQAWLALTPESAQAMGQLAVVLFRAKKSSEAKDQLKAAYEATLEQMKEAGRENTDLVHWGAQMGQFYERVGDGEQAKKWMDYGIKAAPSSLRTWLTTAQWSLSTGQLDQSEAQAAKAMELDPNSLGAKVLRGVVALFKKDFSSAEMYFESAHLQAPAEFAASNNLALALCEQDDPDKIRRALAYAQTNAQANQKSAEAASTFGWVLYKAGKLKEADQVLGRLAQAGRVSEDTAYYIARVSAEVGRKEQAVTLLQQAVASKRPFSMRQEAEALLKELQE